ncbi:hypothetical protein NQ315_008800 [Exocentrus adspersus]|uniref:Transposable element P transposase-like RNase H C-terminal domain-containing protein n=1 Tax=Exocentrus adspersus TaxID=1586481 RepID=A0AAV8VH48_9CUCU|nr:hypothetical protein NQ315_008800 [Exocentrus adspersus]
MLVENGPFEYFLPRAFNQDPLENFFGAIRSHGVRNTSPDVSHFINSFKSLIINNFMSSHSPGHNCEEDFSEGALDNLRSFLTGEEIPGIAPLQSDDDIETPLSVINCKKTRVAENVLYYIANKCEECKNNLTANVNTNYSEFVSVREYDNCNFLRAGGFLNFAVSQCVSYLFFLIPRVCHQKDVFKISNRTLSTKIAFNVLNCKSHPNLSNHVKNVILKCIIYFWCKSINRILNGQDSKFEILYRLNPNSKNLDPIKVLALKKYNLQKKRMRK